MNTITIFGLAGNLAIIGWICLLIVPKWKYTIPYIISFIVLLLAMTYGCLIMISLPGMKPDVFNSLASIRRLFSSDTALLAGWIHYLAFDLLIGVYIVRKGWEFNIPRWAITIILPFTFMFGPIGYVLFQLAKTINQTGRK